MPKALDSDVLAQTEPRLTRVNNLVRVYTESVRISIACDD